MLACFTPIMQWHSEPDGGQFKELMPGGEGNNERSPWNMAAVYNSPEFVTEMRFWHWLRMNLQPYLMATAFRCAAEKVPMMRPLVYEWPRDKAARQVEDEFLLGDAILIAPLLEENQTAREVYLPEGEWYALFTGKCYHGCQTISTTADMKFPVFIRGGYAVPLHADGMDSLGKPVSQNLIDEAAGHGFLVRGTSFDHCSGNTLKDRIGLRSMLDAVENGRIEAVMVRDLEQISRNSYILVGVIEILRQNDVYLITTECDLNAELINSGLERFVGDRFTRASFGKPRFDVRLPLMDQF